MLKRHQDQVYFFHINLLNFFPAPDHHKKITKDSYLKVVLIRQSSTPMFISQFQNIAHLETLAKCIIFENKIYLGGESLKFSIKFSDLSKNDVYFIKIFLVNQQGQKQLTYFKFIVGKYIEIQKLEGKNYFEENLFQKTGSRVQAEIFIERNKAALQMLILQKKQQKRKHKSKPKKLKQQGNGQGSNSLTIEKLYKQAQETKNIRKTMQRSELSKSSQGLMRKTSKYQQLDAMDQSQQSQEIKKPINKSDLGSSKNKCYLDTKKAVDNKRQKLDISKITQVMNSSVNSDEKTNQFENFSRERQKLIMKTETGQKQYGSEKILQNLDITTKTQDIASMIEEIQESSVNTGNVKPQGQIALKSSITSISSLQENQSASRSYLGAIDLGSEQQSSLAHSSQLSAESQLTHLQQKKNKLLWALLIIFFIVAIFYLMKPADRQIEQDLDRPIKKKKRSRK